MQAHVLDAEGGTAQLSSGLNADKYIVHGVALGEDDVTYGKSEKVKRWTKEALEEAAHTLIGKPLVKNHINNDVDAVVGKVTDTRYEDGVGVLFQAETNDESLAEKIHNEWIQVSPRIRHAETEENDDGENVIEKIYEFANLALVPDGASPSNYIKPGNAPEMARAELARAFNYESEELGDGEGDKTPSEERDEALDDDEGNTSHDDPDAEDEPPETPDDEEEDDPESGEHEEPESTEDEESLGKDDPDGGDETETNNMLDGLDILTERDFDAFVGGDLADEQESTIEFIYEF
jgi:hypothetical protein